MYRTKPNPRQRSPTSFTRLMLTTRLTFTQVKNNQVCDGDTPAPYACKHSRHAIDHHERHAVLGVLEVIRVTGTISLSRSGV